VRAIPIVLAAALTVAAALLVAAALVLSVRQRRIDIGVLRALGATGRQIASALTWQALWLYTAAALVGVPLGVIAGRLLWQQIALGIGVLLGAVVPISNIGLITLSGIIIVIGFVFLPARSARRQQPSDVLRTQ
jgi:putative ABC transport system permease protein